MRHGYDRLQLNQSPRRAEQRRRRRLPGPQLRQTTLAQPLPLASEPDVTRFTRPATNAADRPSTEPAETLLVALKSTNG